MAALDPGALGRLRADLGDDESVREVLQSFLEEAPVLGAQLEASLAKGDLAAARRAAHTLKGVAAMVGAQALSDASREVEHACARGDLEGARGLSASALQGLPGVVAAVGAVLASAPGDRGG